MPRKTEKLHEMANFHITLPMTRKTKLKERKILLNKMKSLIERDRESLPTKDISYTKKTISLEADDFACLISFSKPISIQIVIGKDFQKNKNRVNDMANKLVNYVNTILGKSAKNANIFTSLISPTGKGTNLSRKFVDETRLARINELTKKTFNPKGIMLEYTSGKRENAILHFYGEKETFIAVLTKFKYEDSIPWDFIQEEYKNLKESIDIVGKLSQQEF